MTSRPPQERKRARERRLPHTPGQRRTPTNAVSARASEPQTQSVREAVPPLVPHHPYSLWPAEAAVSTPAGCPCGVLTPPSPERPQACTPCSHTAGPAWSGHTPERRGRPQAPSTCAPLRGQEEVRPAGAWVALLFERPTRDFSSGPDLRLLGLDPAWGSVLSTKSA